MKYSIVLHTVTNHLPTQKDIITNNIKLLCELRASKEYRKLDWSAKIDLLDELDQQENYLKEVINSIKHTDSDAFRFGGR